LKKKIRIKDVKGRRGRRRKQIPDDVKEKGGYRKLKEEAVDRTLWRIHFGRGQVPVVRRTAVRMTTIIFSSNMALPQKDLTIIYGHLTGILCKHGRRQTARLLLSYILTIDCPERG
jgi:hypothetical protein